MFTFRMGLNLECAESLKLSKTETSNDKNEQWRIQMVLFFQPMQFYWTAKNCYPAERQHIGRCLTNQHLNGQCHKLLSTFSSMIQKLLLFYTEKVVVVKTLSVYYYLSSKL